MRYARIFLLNMQHIFQERARSFVWFLSSFLQPLLLIAFWSAAFKSQDTLGTWAPNDITAYYLLIGVIATLMPWVEETVSKEDILEGKLSQYLLKPFSYYWFKFYEELPYRFLQCFYALIVITILVGALKIQLIHLKSWPEILLCILILFLSYILAFNYKIIIGLLAFWFVEVTGVLNLASTILMLFAGYVMPLDLLPSAIASFARSLPFAYMIYYPVVAFQGQLGISELMHIILMQIFWISVFSLLYKIIWKKGVGLFTSFGQ